MRELGQQTNPELYSPPSLYADASNISVSSGSQIQQLRISLVFWEAEMLRWELTNRVRDFNHNTSETSLLTIDQLETSILTIDQSETSIKTIDQSQVRITAGEAIALVLEFAYDYDEVNILVCIHRDAFLNNCTVCVETSPTARSWELLSFQSLKITFLFKY